MKRQLKVLLALSVAVLVALVVATPATAQIHEMEKIFNPMQPRLQVTTQRVASEQCLPFCSECIWMDTYDPQNATADFIVHSAATLAAGTQYLITIKGSITVWPQRYWVNPGQGIVDAAPLYPSPGAENWAAFADWEFLYGYYKPITSISFPKPIQAQNISLDGGVNYDHITPIGGQVFNSAHVYQYLVTGTGARAFFKRHDQPTNDNSGIFKICIQKVTVCGDISDQE